MCPTYIIPLSLNFGELLSVDPPRMLKKYKVPANIWFKGGQKITRCSFICGPRIFFYKKCFLEWKLCRKSAIWLVENLPTYRHILSTDIDYCNWPWNCTEYRLTCSNAPQSCKSLVILNAAVGYSVLLPLRSAVKSKIFLLFLSNFLMLVFFYLKNNFVPLSSSVYEHTLITIGLVGSNFSEVAIGTASGADICVHVF